MTTPIREEFENAFIKQEKVFGAIGRHDHEAIALWAAKWFGEYIEKSCESHISDYTILRIRQLIQEMGE